MHGIYNYIPAIHYVSAVFNVAAILHSHVMARVMLFPISFIVPTRSTICFQFITINSLYIFLALICSSPGGTVYTKIGTFLCVLCRLAAGRFGVLQSTKH
jgi:hypothetical protein